MLNFRRFAAAAPLVLVLALAACQAGPEDGGATPAGESPAMTPATTPESTPETTPEATPEATPDTTPDLSPGETESISLPDGGTVTLTQMGAGSTQIRVESPALAAIEASGTAEVRVGLCAEAGAQPMGELEISNGVAEGMVDVPLDPMINLPHSVAFFAQEGADEPVACFDLVVPDASPESS